MHSCSGCQGGRTDTHRPTLIYDFIRLRLAVATHTACCGESVGRLAGLG